MAEQGGRDGDEAARSAQRGLEGRTLNGFRVLQLLGRGGMGDVYLAHEESLGRKVVLKVMAPRLADDPQLVKRFGREVRAVARLNHPNVVTIYSVHEGAGLQFFAMEYVEGESLAEVIAREAPLDADRVLHVAEQAADALACAHGAGVLHRDVKPSNILVAPSGTVKVLDFGIAKVLGEKTELTSDGAFLGTLAYASPEQCEGLALDARTDVYSLGVVLYEMLAGRPPYEADTPLTLMKKIATEDPPDLESFNPHVSPSLRQLIARMIAKERDRRLPDCGTAVEEIRRVRSELGGRTAPVIGAAAAAAVKPAPAEVDSSATKSVVPLGRPADAAEVKPPRRWYLKKRWIALWVFLALFVLAQINPNPNRRGRRQGAASSTPTPAAPTPTPGPAVFGTQPTPRPSPTPAASRWATPTPETAPGATATPAATPATPLPRGSFSIPAALQAVPANRDLVVVFNIRALLASQLVQSNESKVFSREARSNLDAFFGYYGINWERDIDHLALSGQTDRPETLCAMFWGDWDESTIIRQMRKLPRYEVFTHNRASIHGVYHTEHRRMECVVFLAPGVAACGGVQTLREVYDSATRRADSLLSQSTGRAAVAWLSRPAARRDFWAVGVPQPAGANRALSDLYMWVLTGRLAPDLVLEGTAWPRDRSKIEATYNLMNAVVRAWQNHRQNRDLRELGRRIGLARSQNTITVRLEIPYASLVRLLDTATAKGNYPFH